MRTPVGWVGLLCVALAVAIAGCGASQPKSAATQAELQAAVKGAPEPLARLYSRGGEIVDGGPAAYKAQIAALRGYPIVVNKWASWCGPCRFEFPFFQKLVAREGKRIAFFAVDGQDAKSDARAFLKQYPVPYPSFFDPHDKIAKLFRGTIGFPTTSFYDRTGKLVYTKPGGYASLTALEKDTADYAGGGQADDYRQLRSRGSHVPSTGGLLRTGSRKRRAASNPDARTGSSPTSSASAR